MCVCVVRPQSSKNERKRKKISDSDRLFSRSSVTSHMVRERGWGGGGEGGGKEREGEGRRERMEEVEEGGTCSNVTQSNTHNT